MLQKKLNHSSSRSFPTLRERGGVAGGALRHGGGGGHGGVATQGPPLTAHCAGSSAQGEGETLSWDLMEKGCLVSVPPAAAPAHATPQASRTSGDAVGKGLAPTPSLLPFVWAGKLRHGATSPIAHPSEQGGDPALDQISSRARGCLYTQPGVRGVTPSCATDYFGVGIWSVWRCLRVSAALWQLLYLW